MSYIEGRDYEVIIDDIYLDKSKEKQTPFACFKLVCEHGTIWHNMYLTKATATSKGTAAQVAKTMGEFGYSVDDIKKPDFWKTVIPQLIGQKAYITTVLNEWNGKTSVKVEWLNGMPRAKRAPIEGIEDEIASMFEDLEPVPF